MGDVGPWCLHSCFHDRTEDVVWLGEIFVQCFCWCSCYEFMRFWESNSDCQVLTSQTLYFVSGNPLYKLPLFYACVLLKLSTSEICQINCFPQSCWKLVCLQFQKLLNGFKATQWNRGCCDLGGLQQNFSHEVIQDKREKMYCFLLHKTGYYWMLWIWEILWIILIWVSTFENGIEKYWALKRREVLIFFFWLQCVLWHLTACS